MKATNAYMIYAHILFKINFLSEPKIVLVFKKNGCNN